MTEPRLLLNAPLALGAERGAAYKAIEDKVDAILCAYLAALAWLYGEARMEMIGTVEGGAVVVPRPLTRCAFGCCVPGSATA